MTSSLTYKRFPYFRLQIAPNQTSALISPVLLPTSYNPISRAGHFRYFCNFFNNKK